MNVRFQLAFAIISVLFTIQFYSLHHKISRQLALDASEYIRVAGHIPEGSVVLPLNYSENWLHANLPAIAGADRNLLMLDNYEADMLYFPLHWKNGLDPKLTYGNYASSRTPCIPFRELVATQLLPDAVLCWYMPAEISDSCTVDANEQLLQHYRLAFAGASAKVFLLK